MLGGVGRFWGDRAGANRLLRPRSCNLYDKVILEGGDRSLLGQSFLSKFGSVEIRDNLMVLR